LATVSVAGIECKRADAPRLSRSIRLALDDLKLEHVFVICPGIQRYPWRAKKLRISLQALSKGEFLLGRNKSITAAQPIGWPHRIDIFKGNPANKASRPI
jgi:hypothetical protein